MNAEPEPEGERCGRDLLEVGKRQQSHLARRDAAKLAIDEDQIGDRAIAVGVRRARRDAQIIMDRGALHPQGPDPAVLAGGRRRRDPRAQLVHALGVTGVPRDLGEPGRKRARVEPARTRGRELPRTIAIRAIRVGGPMIEEPAALLARARPGTCSGSRLSAAGSARDQRARTASIAAARTPSSARAIRRAS